MAPIALTQIQRIVLAETGAYPTPKIPGAQLPGYAQSQALVAVSTPVTALPSGTQTLAGVDSSMALDNATQAAARLASSQAQNQTAFVLGQTAALGGLFGGGSMLPLLLIGLILYFVFRGR